MFHRVRLQYASHFLQFILLHKLHPNLSSSVTVKHPKPINLFILYEAINNQTFRRQTSQSDGRSLPAMGSKFRSNKRPASSASHTTTVTTIVFIAIGILAVWMLTSNSVSSLQRVSSRVATVSPVNNGVYNGAGKDDGNIYEDNPDDLPDDAIKNDEAKPNTKIANYIKGQEDRQSFNSMSEGEDEKQKENEAQVSEESSMTQKQQAERTEEISNDLDQELQHGSDDTNNGNDDHNINNAQDSKSDENQSGLESEPQAHAIVKKKIQEPTNDQHENNQDQVQEDKGELTKDTQESQIESQSQAEGEIAQADRDEQQLNQEQLSDPSISGTTTYPDETKKSLPTQSEGTKISQQEASEDQHQEPQASGNRENQEFQEQTVTNAIEESAKTTAESNSDVQSLTNTEIPKESNQSKKSWFTQAGQSKNEKKRREDETEKDKDKGNDEPDGKDSITWQLCNVTAGTDYIPCLDNEKAIAKLRSRKHFEHRERHCPDEPPSCLVPSPKGYKTSIIKWPASRDKIWYHNVPHTKLAEFKGHQNWVKVTGEFLTFPGGGTQFIHGALHYIDFLQKSVNDIAWGKRTRVVLDVGCGVASFGGYLFDRDVLTMSFAPKDEHEAQVQFALERGIPGISAVMGSQRLPFPSWVFDMVQCARCRVPWHAEGGKLLLELNRLLRPGGYFVWSATPVYQKLEEDVMIWKEMSKLTASMCWELVTINKDKLNLVGAAIYRKPTSNDCYEKREIQRPPMCKDNDDPNAAWYVPLQACMHRISVDQTQRGAKWPELWPLRLQTPPHWLNSSQEGIYGKPAPQDFEADLEHWRNMVKKNYMKNLGINWSNVRNIMDMRAVYGGFASALKDQPVWVMNVVNVNSPDTLPIIYERGLFGIYHDWCESFSSYPRSYDLLHADRLFSTLKKRCSVIPVLAEVDRLLRPGGRLIVRDESGTIGEVENILKSLHWEVNVTSSKHEERMLNAQKGDWRPETFAASS